MNCRSGRCLSQVLTLSQVSAATWWASSMNTWLTTSADPPQHGVGTPGDGLDDADDDVATQEQTIDIPRRTHLVQEGAHDRTGRFGRDDAEIGEEAHRQEFADGLFSQGHRRHEDQQPLGSLVAHKGEHRLGLSGSRRHDDGTGSLVTDQCPRTEWTAPICGGRRPSLSAPLSSCLNTKLSFWALDISAGVGREWLRKALRTIRPDSLREQLFRLPEHRGRRSQDAGRIHSERNRARYDVQRLAVGGAEHRVAVSALPDQLQIADDALCGELRRSTTPQGSSSR